VTYWAEGAHGQGLLLRDLPADAVDPTHDPFGSRARQGPPGPGVVLTRDNHELIQGERIGDSPARPDADAGLVDDDQRALERFVRNLGEKPLKSALGFLYGRGPHAKADHSVMRADGEGALVGKIFVESDDDGASCLGLLEHFPVGFALKPGVTGMGHGSGGTQSAEPVGHLDGDVLVEED